VIIREVSNMIRCDTFSLPGVYIIASDDDVNLILAHLC
jgi:hypothetical protein